MKLQRFTRIGWMLAMLGLLSELSLFGQGTIFTYQGQLNDNGALANGTNYGMLFTVYNDPLAGASQGESLGIVSVTVSNGLFTVPLDFGNIFDGSARWLEIKVQKNGGLFTILNPRQRITPAPYAVFAGSASNLTGTVSAGQLSGTYSGAVNFNNATNNFTGNGQNLSSVDAATLAGLGAFDLWQLGGNNVASGQFIGSTNNRSVEIRVNNLRVMQYSYASNSVDYYSPNMIGGNSINAAAPGVVGAVIGGGGVTTQTNLVVGDYGVIGGGWDNRVGRNAFVGGGVHNYATNEAATIAGGSGNIANGVGATVGGGGYDGFLGLGNSALGRASTVSGGNANNATNDYAAVAGGYGGLAGGFYATVGGGSQNTATGPYATVPGGGGNTASGKYSFAAGYLAQALHPGAFVWADSQTALFSSTTSNQFLIRAGGGVGIGTGSPSAALHVASAASIPELQITQSNPNDYTRLRMNVVGWAGSPSWEIDVHPSATPALEFWNSGTLGPRMVIDYAGNVSAVSFNPTSDRNAKENFESINPREVLEKVAALELTKWNFKQDAATKHVGPMAQDFHAAFGLGLDDKHIATVDADGVAFAAIQGLNGKVEERMQHLERENADLKSRLEKLERLLADKASDARNNFAEETPSSP